MKNIFAIVLVVLASLSSVYGQYTAPQNKRWTFGYNAGVDFTSGTPTAFSTAMTAVEGTATVSDASGNLLFYSEGTQVWNRLNNVMPSGGSLVSFSTASATQGTLVVPKVGDPNKYYLFSLEGVPGGASYCQLAYCVVDMTLDGGLGDVISSTLGTPLADVMSEKMIAIPGNSCNIWLLVHRKDSAVFMAYNITAAGISAPVISTVGTFTTIGSYGGYSIGAVKVSHDRSRLVTANWNSGGSMGVELYDFNATTGVVSNCTVIDNSAVQYGAEFSPDNTKLYIQGSASITQYDLSAGSTAAIIASAYTVGASAYWSALRIGPDNKIYFGGSSTSFLGAITSPNTAGAGCGYNGTAVALASGSSFSLGLPNLNVAIGGGDTTFSRRDTTVCIASGTSINLTARTITAAVNNYLWNDGITTAIHTTTAPGVYWVIIDTGGCHHEMDTIVVTSPPIVVTPQRRDTTLCSPTGSVVLTAPTGYATYLWNDGSGGTTLTASATGTYYVYCALDCNAIVDTINVTLLPYNTTTSTKDTGYCFPGELILAAPVGYPTYLWQNGSPSTSYKATASGTYWVTYSAACESHTDTTHIIPTPLSLNLGPDVSVCMNYAILPSLQGQYYTYLWQDGSRSNSYSASHTGDYWVTIKQGDCVASDTVHVDFIHFTQNLPDTFICKDVPFAIPYMAQPPVGGSVLWENGSTNPLRVIRDSGSYWVYVKYQECEILDSIHINTGYCDCWYNVPTGFTPNNDGLNDVVKPRIQPGCTISGYSFNVYNRWGELLFNSEFPGKGWDGTFKGEPVDIGVYYYSLQFFIGVKDKQVVYNGNITLVR